MRKIFARKFLAMLLAAIAALPCIAGGEREKKYYTMDDIIHTIKTKNFNVRLGAEKVYQNRLQLRLNMGLLLPRLNYGSALFILAGGVFNLVPQLLGFVYPNNWFMWERQVFIFDAQRHLFTSLIANEINAVEGMVYQTHALMMTVKVYEDYLANSTDFILRIITQLVHEGVLKPVNINIVKATREEMIFDIENIRNEIDKFLVHIADVMNVPTDDVESFALAPIPIPDLTKIEPVEVDILQRAAIKESHDLEAYSYLVEAAKANVYQSMFEFVSPTAFTIYAGFGFGYTSYLKLAKSQLVEWEERRDQLVQNTFNAVSFACKDYNQSLRNYVISMNLRNTAKAGVDMLIAEIENGGVFDASSFVRLIGITLSASVKGIANQHKYLIARAQLDRLTWRRTYFTNIMDSMVPEATNAERGVSGLLRLAEGFGRRY